MEPLEVVTSELASKKETLDNILRSGDDEQILKYMETKNIFDSNIFNCGMILWKLKD